MVHLAKTAGYDTLFIDHEHAQMSVSEAGQLCTTALSAGVTPFVRVPYQCGDGYVQKILDAGAMGVIFPHVNSVEDAKKCIRVTKYPPIGGRSWTNGLSHFEFQIPAPAIQVAELNQFGSTVFVQIESGIALENVDAIAAVQGVDVLLVGSNDLALEMGILGEWDNTKLMEAFKKVGDACRKHGKVFGIAGIYHRPDLMASIVNEFGARYALGGVDDRVLSAAMKQNSGNLKAVQKQN